MTLSHDAARAFYDRFGAKQDWQRFYEDRALADLIAHAGLGTARRVLEFGSGTGRLALTLLRRRLPQDAEYLGIDISPTMVSLARDRLAPFAPRAAVRLSDGDMRLDAAAGSFDRVISAYVLDLLSEDDIAALIGEAHRVLAPRGLLGLVHLTHGTGPVSRWIERAWGAVYARRPDLLGGCRPIPSPRFPEREWRILHSDRISQLGLVSQVAVVGRV